MIAGHSGFARLVVGLVAGYAVLEGTAAGLQSTRGEFGLAVAVGVILALLLAGRMLFAEPLRVAWRVLGLGRPIGLGVLAATALSGGLVALLVLGVVTSGISVQAWPGWPLLVVGLFAQAGVAEETLFRAYLFGRLRRGRSFWRAALIAAVPFIVVHLLLFASMPWPVAAASLVLAASMSFPLSHLYELGGHTIWPPAILHFVTQAALKVIVLPAERTEAVAIAWIAACAMLPWIVFLVRRRDSAPGTASA